jgi:helicase
MFDAWINEVGEDLLLDEYGIAPGNLRARLEIADWLLYAARELAWLLRLKKVSKELMLIRMRMRYGIKAELLPLVKLHGIGRVRARKLFVAGFRRIADLRKAPAERIAEVVGINMAKKIKDQITLDRAKPAKIK